VGDFGATNVSSRQPLGCFRALFHGCLILGIVWLAGSILIPPMPGGIRYPVENNAMQTAHQLGLTFYSYAMDNNGQYPDGKSSTEIFQKLMEGGYITDPTLFYLPMEGKVQPIPGQRLKPENVSWDVTGGADQSSPDGLPMVFIIRYNVSYASGGGATSRVRPYPRFGWVNPNQTTARSLSLSIPQRMPPDSSRICFRPTSGPTACLITNSHRRGG
jgi:hypothetical protein